MLMTTGNSFDGYHVEKYLGIVSKEAVCIGIESDKIDTTTLSFSLHEIAMNQTLRNTQQSNIRSKIDNTKKAILGALGNVTNPSLHLFRHTFAKNYILAGGGLVQMQMILGQLYPYKKEITNC